MSVEEERRSSAVTARALNVQEVCGGTMASLHLLLCLALLAGMVAAAKDADDDVRFALPDDLLIGAGVAAVQTEGAWNKGGKSESMLDHALHSGRIQPLGFYKDPHLSDDAANSYYRYKEDVAMAAQLKFQVYRMSISWARLLPEGDPSKVNKEGLDYYHSFIDEILKYNMTPLVTIYHFDHPYLLEREINGWMDRRMVDKFRGFSELVFSEFAPKVKLWTTINEPNVYCSFFIDMIAMADLKPKTTNIYPCLHYLLLAHGAAYQAFKEGGYEGTVGFTITTLLSRPRTTSPEDVYASNVYNQMFAALLVHPLVHGDYPELVKELAGDKLPTFTDEEKKLLKNSTDYIGLNVYYLMSVAYKSPDSPAPNTQVPLKQIFADAPFLHVTFGGHNGMTYTTFPYDLVAPDTVRSALMWAWLNYKLPIFITENGIGTNEMTGVDDQLRAAYHSAFLREIVTTIHDSGVKVMGYCMWSLIDSFEFMQGYDRPFGAVHVDYQGGSLNRSLKESSRFWVELAERRVVPLVLPPDSAAADAATAAPSHLVLVALTLLTASTFTTRLWA